MAKDKISDYSSTANSNTDIAGINIDEGCAPSGINDAIRTLMAQLKNFQTGTGGDSFNGPFAGTTIAATDTTDASSTTAAAMKTAGGLAVAKKAYIGLDANIYGLTVGRGAGSVSTNTAVGASALATVSSSAHTTAVGNAALNLIASNGYATAVGSNALNKATGANNTAVGAYAGQNTTTGADNLFLGEEAAVGNTTGSYNVAVGRTALYSNTTASNNTAVGYQAGYTATVSAYNTFIGYLAGYSHNLGSAGNGLNTFIGQSAGYNITTGTKNTIIGTYNGNQGGLNITTASNWVVLSDGDGNLGVYGKPGASDWTINTGTSGTLYCPGIYTFTSASAANVFVNSGGALLRSTSAAKYKQDIRDVEDFDISVLRPVRYKSNCQHDDQTKDHLGLIADEAAEAGFEELVTRGADGEIEGFQYERLTVVLLKKLQVLEAEVKALKGQA